MLGDGGGDDDQCQRPSSRFGSRHHGARASQHRPLVCVTKGICHVMNDETPSGFEQTITGCARRAESCKLPPVGLDPPDLPQVVRFFNNYWIAPADAPWAIL